MTSDEPVTLHDQIVESMFVIDRALSKVKDCGSLHPAVLTLVFQNREALNKLVGERARITRLEWRKA